CTMQDEVTKYNQARWDALVQANVPYSRPFLDLDAESAEQVVNAQGVMAAVRGKRVLCLASGCGQQSAAFGLLGAEVAVLDFSGAQLERDQQAFDHYGLQVQLVQGDMRDLSAFADDSFDLVWQAYSINFIPDVAPVFDEITRVLRPGGQYRVEWWNPFTKGTDETTWTGDGYLLKRPYTNGEVQFDDTDWMVQGFEGAPAQKVEGPREFNHTLSTVLNGLITRG